VTAPKRPSRSRCTGTAFTPRAVKDNDNPARTFFFHLYTCDPARRDRALFLLTYEE
jgi:hypothetical protein